VRGVLVPAKDCCALRAAAALARKQKAYSLAPFDGFSLDEAITRAIAEENYAISVLARAPRATGGDSAKATTRSVLIIRLTAQQQGGMKQRAARIVVARVAFEQIKDGRWRRKSSCNLKAS
jgi:hypothetical protein